MASGNTAIFELESAVATDHKRRDLLELSVGYALILVVIWTPRPWQRLSYGIAASFLVTVLWLARPGWKAMGLQPSNAARSLWLIGIALLASAVAILVASRMHTLRPTNGPLMFLERFAGYAVGACLQQFLLQDFFLPRLLRLMRGPGSAALVAAAMFSLAHLPNPILTVITFFWGVAACLYFLRYRNLYTLAIAHTILGITVAMTVPGPVIRNMRVGIGYLTYSSRHGHQRNH
jgi:membrane protease YdiL (CAAX protease family)